MEAAGLDAGDEIDLFKQDTDASKIDIHPGQTNALENT
jgi:hypothetical protein